jgi:hypothetical protein
MTVLGALPDVWGPYKRQKTIGLNSRFDLMLERINLTLQDPQTSMTAVPSRQGRARARSNGSSSVSSGYDLPKTPVDTYNGLEDGRLGQTFSVIKMKSTSGSKVGGYYRGSEGYESDMKFEESARVRIFSSSYPQPDNCP